MNFGVTNFYLEMSSDSCQEPITAVAQVKSSFAHCLRWKRCYLSGLFLSIF